MSIFSTLARAHAARALGREDEARALEHEAALARRDEELAAKDAELRRAFDHRLHLQALLISLQNVGDADDRADRAAAGGPRFKGRHPDHRPQPAEGAPFAEGDFFKPGCEYLFRPTPNAPAASCTTFRVAHVMLRRPGDTARLAVGWANCPDTHGSVWQWHIEAEGAHTVWTLLGTGWGDR